jgi:hypothetical protein
LHRSWTSGHWAPSQAQAGSGPIWNQSRPLGPAEWQRPPPRHYHTRSSPCIHFEYLVRIWGGSGEVLGRIWRSRGGRVRPSACLVVETGLIRAWLAGGMADFDACLRLPTAHGQIRTRTGRRETAVPRQSSASRGDTRSYTPTRVFPGGGRSHGFPAPGPVAKAPDHLAPLSGGKFIQPLVRLAESARLARTWGRKAGCYSRQPGEPVW